MKHIVPVIFGIMVVTIISGCVTEPPEHSIPGEIKDINEFISSMERANVKVGIWAPVDTDFNNNETTSYVLGIRQIDSKSPMKFYINVYLEALGGKLPGDSVEDYKNVANGWLSYPRASNEETVIVNPSETEIVCINITPTDASAGELYMYRVVVCDSLPCEAVGSDNQHGTSQFVLEIGNKP